MNPGPVTPGRLIRSAATLRPGDVVTVGRDSGLVVKSVAVSVWFEDGTRTSYPVDVVVDRVRL